MKYLEFDNTYGRLSNHFYLLFQTYKYRCILNDEIKMIKNKSFYDFKLDAQYKLFNLDWLAEDRKNIKADDIIYKNIQDPIQRYHQIFRLDFIIEQIEAFVKDTFLKSQVYSNVKLDNNDNCIAIHIRNGDYINDVGMDVFDRYKYIESALKKTNNRFDNLVVYSDDNNLNEKLYDELFHYYIKNVTYVKNTTGTEDFINFSIYKNKILWNSTFSYWAAFIGNVLHQHSYSNVIAPSRFGKTDPIADHLNPLWTIIEV